MESIGSTHKNQQEAERPSCGCCYVLTHKGYVDGQSIWQRAGVAKLCLQHKEHAIKLLTRQVEFERSHRAKEALYKAELEKAKQEIKKKIFG